MSKISEITQEVAQNDAVITEYESRFEQVQALLKEQAERH